MTQEQQEQAKKLLKATLDILEKCDEGPYVKNVFEESAIWDNAECDGYCLFDELKELIKDIQEPTHD